MIAVYARDDINRTIEFAPRLFCCACNIGRNFAPLASFKLRKFF
jgi:hypothetical protein